MIDDSSEAPGLSVGLGFAFASTLALFAASSGGAAALPDPLPARASRIGTIRIRALDVFSPEEASRGWLYRTADAVRFSTRESVIRQFLLFREGDVYDPPRLAETERNLRALSFLKSASVTAGPEHGGIVDVEVVTQDAWTTQPGVSFGKKGGATTYGFVLKEKDFLGTGRELSLAYDKGTERTDRSFEYIDPYFLAPYVIGDFLYANNSDGDEERVSVARPFSSFVTPWAAAILFDHLTLNDRIFAGGETSTRYRVRHTQEEASYGRAIAASDDRAQRLTLRFRAFEDRFTLLPSSPSDVLPDDRRFRFVSVRYDDVRNDFLKLDYVNRAERYEDFNLGRTLSAEVGISPAAFGTAKTTGLLRLRASQGWRLGPASFFAAAIAYQTRWDGDPENEILSGSLLYVRKLETTRPLQTFVSRLTFDRGWNLDRDVQFFADGGNGLRGYRLYAFEGDKRVVWNAEQRFFFPHEILQLFSPGAAVFFDTGAATPPGQPLRFSDFKSDVGVGLRIAISRAATNSVLRFDVAYALDRDPKRRRGLLVSFSSGQAF